MPIVALSGILLIHTLNYIYLGTYELEGGKGSMLNNGEDL